MSALSAAAAFILASGAAASAVTPGHAAVDTAALSLRLHGSDEPDCHGTCNGEKIHHADITADSWPLYQCWGKFTFACEDTSKDKTVHTFMKCDGAFLSKRKETKEDDGSSSALRGGAGSALMPPNGTETYVSCEGRFTQFAKAMMSSDAEDLEPELTMKKCRKKKYRGGTKAVISGQACSGKFKTLIVVEDDGKTVGGSSCDSSFVDGVGVKLFPQHKSRKHVLKKLRKAEKHFKKAALKGARAHPLCAGAQDAAVGWVTLQDSVRGAANARSGSAGCAARGGEVSDAPDCVLTCNKSRRSGKWAKWLPCWGDLSFDCKGSKEKACFENDFECTGFSWPAFKMCKGNFVNHKVIAIDTEEKDKPSEVEVLAVTSGYKRFSFVKKDGWKGVMSFAHGHSSTRFSLEYDEKHGAEQATVGELAEPADQQLAVSD